MSQKNLVSVIIPMYNSRDTIVTAINSVINQTYKGKIELIVVDDGSIDESAKLVQNFGSQIGNVQIKLISQKNGGVSKARNTGLKASSGEFIALLDSDDEWLPQKLSVQIPYLINECDFVTSLRNDDSIFFPYKVINNQFAEMTLNKLLFKIVGQTSTAVFKKVIISEVGYFDENQKYSEDANFWMKVSVKFRMLILNEKLVITGGGKPSVGFSGLSANLKAMEEGVQKNISEMYKLGYLNLFEFYFFKVFSKIKYEIRKIKYR